MLYIICFFKQKTAYEMRISDWSSDVCSSDLGGRAACRQSTKSAARNGSAIINLAKCELWLNCGKPLAANWGVDNMRKDKQITASVAEIGRASCRERVCQYV